MNANLRGKGTSPTNDFWHQKTRVPGLSYGKKIEEKFNRLSRVHQRHRQTDNRQTTDGRPIAYSERNVVRSLKINKNSSGDEIANVNFLRRYGTYVLQNTKKREPTSFNKLDDS